MEPVETIIDAGRGVTIRIYQDDDTQNPRSDWEHTGRMACAHKRYTLGDAADAINTGNFNGWDEIESWLESECDAALILPLYLYDHSGLTISTSPFSCPWDSGQIGFIYMKTADYTGAFDSNREVALACLEAEVQEYDQYLTGDVYYYTAEYTESGEVFDSCGGLYGLDYAKQYAAEAIAHMPVQERMAL